MTNLKISKTATTTNAKKFALFISVKVDAKALRTVKGGGKYIIIEDSQIG